MGSGIQMEESGTARAEGHAAAHHDTGLMAIGVVKLVEAVFFFLVGLGVIHFIHRDLGDAALRLAVRLKLDLGGRLMTWVLDHQDDVTASRLKQIGIFTFFYAGLRVIEGVGLVMEKVWAEYLTVGATTIFLPWELYEFAKRPDWIRVCLLIGNLTVLAYLSWNLRRSRRAGKTPGR
jgi:uncharacterized membrane protein (DUF2068 family)